MFRNPDLAPRIELVVLRSRRSCPFTLPLLAVLVVGCAADVDGPSADTEVAVQSAALTQCPASGNLALNGGFESQLASWSTQGQVSATPYAWSGSWGAQIGSTTALSGWSTLYQFIQLPSCGRPMLRFRYKTVCGGSFPADQSIVEVRDGGMALLATVLNVCTNQDWTELSYDLSRFRGTRVFLRFTNKDDGVANKASYFRVDNVVVNNRVDDYRDYLTGNPQVLDMAVSADEDGGGPTFTQADWATFYDAAAWLEQYGKLPPIDPAQLTALQNCVATWQNPFNCSNHFTARNLAYALWLELNHKVPWSLAELTRVHLHQLLSLSGKPNNRLYYDLLIRPDVARSMFLQYAMPGQSLTTRADLEVRMARWIRDHIEHADNLPAETPLHDIAAFFTGPTNCQDQSTRMCIGSCWNNNHFMSTIATAFNVPAVATRNIGGDSMTNHDYMDFPRESTSLIHSDDLYSYNSLQNAPVDLIFFSGYRRDQYMQNTTLQYLTAPAAPNAALADIAHYQHNSWLYFQYPDAALLSHVCSGRAAVMTWLQGWWGIPAAAMSDVAAYYMTWESSLRASAGC